MSTINTSLSNTAAARGAGGTGSTNRFSDLSTEEFVRVIFTELQSQDPFQPQDSGKLLEQLSSLRNIESQTTLQEDLKELVRQNQAATAGTLIGRRVEGLTATNETVRAQVQSVRVGNDGVILELAGGKTLEMSRMTRIIDDAQASGSVESLERASELQGVAVVGQRYDSEGELVFGTVAGSNMTNGQVLLQLDNGQVATLNGLQDVGAGMSPQRLMDRKVQFTFGGVGTSTAFGTVKKFTDKDGVIEFELQLDTGSTVTIKADQLTGVMKS